MAVLTEAELKAKIASNLATGKSGGIQAAEHREILNDLLDSIDSIFPPGQGPAGAAGTNGWTPVYRIVSDGERRVIQVADLVGGSGSQPANYVNMYIGAAGLVSTAAQAVDIRGAAGATGARGPAGAAGAAGQGVPAGGAAGQILEKTSGTDYDTQWVNKPTGGGTGGSSTFIGLSDTPPAFGSAGQAVVVNSAGDGLAFSTISGGGTAPTDPAPYIDGFTIDGVSRNPTAPFNLTGSQTFRWNLHNPSSVSGNLTLSQAGTALGATIATSASSVQRDITDIALTANQSIAFTISGTATATAGGAPFSATFTIRAVAAGTTNYVYLFWSDNNDATATANALVQGNRHVFAEPQPLTIPTGTGNQYLVYAQRNADDDPTAFQQQGLNQLGAYTKYATSQTAGSVSYDLWISNHLLITSLWNGTSLTVVRT